MGTNTACRISLALPVSTTSVFVQGDEFSQQLAFLLRSTLGKKLCHEVRKFYVKFH